MNQEDLKNIKFDEFNEELKKLQKSHTKYLEQDNLFSDFELDFKDYCLLYYQSRTAQGLEVFNEFRYE